ncbi:hypothetical protein TWF481_008452 [Arthrobotrys musiformis]|uniref:Uncharacterized protein n=1 Tax=Arthrobotrys musiformis TaxID=47236 RepID=A0AAV9W769_9PEZI
MIPNTSNTAVSALIIAFCRITYVEAYPFTPECTIPPPGTSHVFAPTVRSTLSIIWNCLGIIFLCTWSIQHLNIPLQRSTPDPQTSIGILKGHIIDFLEKLKWVVFTLIFPEFLFAKAVLEWCATKEGVKNHQLLRSGGAEKQARTPQWEAIHICMANAGYFVLDTGMPASRQPSVGKIRIEDTVLRGRYWALNNRQWISLALENDYADLPDVDAEYLRKLDHKGGLITVLAVLQITSHIIQLVSRKINKLPITQIESVALAFAIPSILVYLLYWDHPQGVRVIHVSALNLSKLPGSSEEDKIERLRKMLFRWRHAGVGPYMLTDISQPDQPDPDEGPVPIPNNCVPLREFLHANGAAKTDGSDMFYKGAIPFLGGGGVHGMIFGGLHILAWDSIYHTRVEQICWRVSSIVVTVIPFIAFASTMLGFKMEDVYPRYQRLHGPFFIGLAIIYMIARLFLMVEMFISLAYLPPEAFKTTWAGLLPHWG